MKPFNVLSPGIFFDENIVHTTIKSFAHLFNNVSPKHKRRIKMIFVEEAEFIPKLKALLRFSGLENANIVIDRSVIDGVEGAYNDASIFLFPGIPSCNKIIPEALSFGLPILTFDTPSCKEYLDKSCSMLVRKQKYSDQSEEFAEMMEMLYFDPQVQQLMAKGAAHKFSTELSWSI